MGRIKRLVKRHLPKRLVDTLSARHHGAPTGDPHYPYQAYNDELKLVFIHIPKTAGTSILSFLAGPDAIRCHAPYNWYLQSDPARFYHYHKLCFVRDPWDRAVSLFAYLSQGGNGDEDLTLQQQIKDCGGTFADFVLKWLSPSRIFALPILRQQSFYVYDYVGERLLVDQVCQFEQIDQEIAAIGKRFGIARTLPRANPSKRSKHLSYYTSDTIARISELYPDDIELFGYSAPQLD